MALSDEIREQRKSLRGQGVKAHLLWFWEYYRIQTALVVLAAILIGSTIYSIATRKPQAASVLFINVEGSALLTSGEELEAALAEAAGIDLREETITLDLTGRITPGGARDQAEMATQEKVVAYVAARDLDLLGADAWNFASYARIGAFMDLRELLTGEQMAKYEPYFYYVEQSVIDGNQEEALASEGISGEEASYDPEREAAAESEKMSVFVLPDPAAMENPVPVGILLNAAPNAANLSFYTETAGLVGVLSTAQHTRAAARMIDYLWDGN